MGAPRRNARVVSENASRTSADDAKNASASRSGVQAISYSNATGARDSSFREVSFPTRSGPRAPSPQHSMPPPRRGAWSRRCGVPGVRSAYAAQLHCTLSLTDRTPRRSIACTLAPHAAAGGSIHARAPPNQAASPRGSRALLAFSRSRRPRHSAPPPAKNAPMPHGASTALRFAAVRFAASAATAAEAAGSSEPRGIVSPRARGLAFLFFVFFFSRRRSGRENSGREKITRWWLYRRSSGRGSSVSPCTRSKEKRATSMGDGSVSFETGRASAPASEVGSVLSTSPGRRAPRGLTYRSTRRPASVSKTDDSRRAGAAARASEAPPLPRAWVSASASASASRSDEPSARPCREEPRKNARRSATTGEHRARARPRAVGIMVIETTEHRVTFEGAWLDARVARRGVRGRREEDGLSRPQTGFSLGVPRLRRFRPAF